MTYRKHPVKAVMDLSCIFHRVVEREMADLCLTSIQSRVLGYLYFQSAQGQKIFQRELEEEFKIRKSSVTSVLQILEKKGLVRRISVCGDARRKELLLTEQGILVQEQVIGRLDALEQRVNDIMTPEEEQVLSQCIEKIVARLKEAEYD